MKSEVKIDPEWKEVLQDYFKTREWESLAGFVRNEYLSGKKIFPEAKNIFKAFDLTPFSKVKVVILGQDPYHGERQAHGLCFSVPQGIEAPPSVKNIYKEIENDLGIKKDFQNGDLTNWAEQGVFLLNAILTVVANIPASHRGKNWEKFTDRVIELLSANKDHLVFMLWGNYARQKNILIDKAKHLILESVHPSPFSVESGFFGCKHFSKCNQYLKKHLRKEIDW